MASTLIRSEPPAAVPGYVTVPPDARGGEGPFSAAVAKTGADGVLIVRLLRVDQKTQVSTIMMPGPWGGYYGGGFYGGGFGGVGMYPVQEVTQYQVASVETNLYAVSTRTLIWSATTQTIDPKTVPQEAPGYADLIIGQFRARGLIPPAAK